MERLPDDRVDHVADPLLRDLAELLLVRQVVVHVLAAVVEVAHDVLERQALVLRDRDVLDLLALDHYIENTPVRITPSRDVGVIGHLRFFLPCARALRK